jgi:hypothetical protein
MRKKTGMRRCGRCRFLLPITEFNDSPNTGLDTTCRMCKTQQQKEYRSARGAKGKRSKVERL